MEKIFDLKVEEKDNGNVVFEAFDGERLITRWEGPLASWVEAQIGFNGVNNLFISAVNAWIMNRNRTSPVS